MKNYDSLIDALSDLKKRGYEADFETETTCLYCSDLDMRLNPEAFHVDEVYRFEGDSNPDDNSIVYAIFCDRCKRHASGCLWSLFGLSKF